MENLNPKERRVYNYILKFQSEHGYAPTVRELSSALGYRSTSSVHMYLKRLEMFGFITGEDGKSRSFKIVDERLPRFFFVPLVSKNSVENEKLVIEKNEGYIGYCAREDYEKLFALTVGDMSLSGEGIFDGDTAIFKSCCYAENGETVALYYNEDIIIRLFYRTDRGYIFKTDKSPEEDIVSDEAVILGKLVSLQRNYT